MSDIRKQALEYAVAVKAAEDAATLDKMKLELAAAK